MRACPVPGVTKKDYFPYGDEIGGATTGNVDKFGTYLRDGATGLDYADQRYFAGMSGRFLTSDSYEASGGVAEPSSWNRVSYVGGDPVNTVDPSGQYWEWMDSFVNFEVGISTSGGWAGGGGGGWWGCQATGFTGASFCGLMYDLSGAILAVGPPPEPPKPSCSISVSSSGIPRDGQSVQVGAAAPPTNSLGSYRIDDGWYFAVQVQGNLFGDLNPDNWVATQTAAVTGTIRYMLDNLLGPSLLVKITVPVDDPEEFAIKKSSGRFNWVDTPGVPFERDGNTVASAFLTYRFASTLTHQDGATCSVNWTISYRIQGDRWDLRFR